MTGTAKPRSHLVERAMEALGGPLVLDRPNGATSGAAAPPPAAASSAVPDAAPAPAPLPAEAAPEPVGLAKLKAAGLIAAAGVLRSRLSEELNLVQHQVLRTMRTTMDADGRCGRIVLVTSARPGEGKSFSSLNLAASIAAGGSSRVVLVDADGKRGSLSELLGVSGLPGLRLLGSGDKRPPAQLLIPTAQERLLVLPYGAQAPSGPELPPGEMVAACILRLAMSLPGHIIVVDSPPCLSTSDPSSLALVAGQVLMVVEAERTQQAEVEAALDIVDACPTLQLMLNRSRYTASDSFGAYGSYDIYGAYGARPAS